MPTGPLTRRWPAVLRALIVVFLGTGLLTAIPLYLIHTVGWPLPRRIPDQETLQAFLVHPLTDDALLDLLAITIWTLWGLQLLSLLIELVSALARAPVPRLAALTPFQSLAAALIGTTGITTLPAASTPLAVASATAELRPAAPTTSATGGPHDHEATHPHPSGDRTSDSDGSEPRHRTLSGPTRRTHRVKTGESLWSIAHHYLGDGDRWHEIYHLNAGRPQPDGDALHDPDLIQAGWVLLLPNHPLQPPPSGHRPGHTATPPVRPSSPRPSSPGIRTPAQPSPSGNGQSSTAPPANGAQAPPRHVPETPPSPVTSPEGQQRNTPAHVDLSTGSVIGVTLLTSLALALLLAGLHRRRRRIPSPTPGTGPAEPPLPPALAAVRRTHLTTGPSDMDDLSVPGAQLQAPPPAQGSSDERGPADRQRNGTDLVPSPSTGDAPPPDAIPDLNALAWSSHLPAAGGDSGELDLLLDHTPGIGLTGPTADHAARNLAVTLLARRTKDQPRLLIPSTDAVRLFGTTATLNTVPGATLHPDLETALTELEAEVIRRGRLLHTQEPPDKEEPAQSAFATYRATHPDEPLEDILLITTAPTPALTARTSAVLTLGQTLGIMGLILGPWPAATLTLDPHGHVTTAEGPGTDHLTGTRMYTLTRTDAAHMLTTIAAAHDPHAARAPDNPAPTTQLRTQNESSAPPEEVGVPIPAAQPEDPAVPARPEPQPRSPGRKPIRFSILGPIRLTAGDTPIGKGSGLFRRSLNILLYLALHPDGATADTLADLLWPTSTQTKAVNSLYSATANLRQTLRKETGLHQEEFLHHEMGRYHLNAEAFDIDHWNFRAALTRAARTTGQPQAQALAEAVSHITGPLDAWPAEEWLDTWKDTLRRDITDTLTRLATHLQPANPEIALTLHEQALTHDPYAEDTYRHIMTLQATLGRPDAITRTYHLLQTRLKEIDTDPDEETTRLLAKIKSERRQDR